MELLEDEMTLWVWEEKEDTTAATGKCNGLRLIEAYLGLYLPVDSLKFLESPPVMTSGLLSSGANKSGPYARRKTAFAGSYPETAEGCPRSCDDSRMTYSALHPEKLL